MARFKNDTNQVVLLLESGTYGNSSGAGVWPGMVQNHSIVDSQNVITTRFLGQGTRNIGTLEDGPRDIEGTITFFPQDWRLLGFALGSITTTSGTAQSDNYKFDITEQNSGSRHNAFTSGTFNPWISFTLEESSDAATANQNVIRTFKGCVVDSYALNIDIGTPISADVNFIAQTGSFTSGTITTATAGSNRPYLWSDVDWQLPGGTSVQPVKSLNFTVENNFEGPHYLNGSRFISDPIPLNRYYTVEVTQDLDSTTAGSFYHRLFLGGSKFNAVLDINNTFNTGSHRLTVTFSGCRITEMEFPGTLDGVREFTYTVVPGSVSAIAHDRLPLYTLF